MIIIPNNLKHHSARNDYTLVLCLYETQVTANKFRRDMSTEKEETEEGKIQNKGRKVGGMEE